MPQPIASWNPERDVWETDQGDLFSEHLDVFSETWPRSGTWAAGMAYELPTSAHHMDDSASSLSRLMPTPTVDDSSNLTRTSGEFQSLTRTIVELSQAVILPDETAELLDFPKAE